MQVLAKNIVPGDNIAYGDLAGFVQAVESYDNGWMIIHVEGGYALDVLRYTTVTVRG